MILNYLFLQENIHFKMSSAVDVINGLMVKTENLYLVSNEKKDQWTSK